MLGPPVQGRAGLSLCGPSPVSAASLLPVCLTGDTPTCQRRDPTVPGLTVGDSKLPSESKTDPRRQLSEQSSSGQQLSGLPSAHHIRCQDQMNFKISSRTEKWE